MPDARISELPLASALADTDLAPLVQASGAGLETRRATVTQLRAGVLADRGAHVRDYGAKGDGTTNDAPAIQAAVNDLAGKGGGVLHFGPKVYRLASAITINSAAILFQGAGFTEGPAPGHGTWLKIDSTSFVPFTFTGVAARGSGIRDLAVTQSHTATQDANWAPTNYGYVFRVEDCFGGVGFDNLYLVAVNRGIYARNSGRLDIRRLRGQVFTCGVEIDECYDVPRLHNIHFWTFWTSNANVIRWQQANGDAMLFRRSDGVFIDQAFALGYRSMFRFASSAAGITSKFYIGQAYSDFSKYGVLIEGNKTDGQIANLTTHGETFDTPGTAIAGSAGVQVSANNCRVQIGNLRIDAVEDTPVRVDGTGNRLDIFSLRCVRFNSRATGAAAIHLADSGAGTPNAVHLGSPPLLEGSSTGPLTNGGSNATLAMQAPPGRVAQPGLQVGASDTGLFLPASATLAGVAGGVEVLRATSAGTITLGAAPGSHALEVATPVATSNRLVASGGATGNAVALLAQGADANIGLAVSPKGTGPLSAQAPDSTAAGGNARGSYAVDWQTTRGAATQVASGTGATIAGGINNTASGAQATVGGGNACTASGANAAVSGGISNNANGIYSWIPGGASCNTRGVWGRGAWGSGQFATSGDAQAGEHVLRRQTTDGTAARLTSDHNGASASNTVNLPANGTYMARLLVVARQTGGSAGTAGDSAGWTTEVLVRRGATAAATVLVGGGGASLAPSYSDAGAAAWRLSVAADTTNGAIAVSGTGEANKTINWVARVLSAECVG